MGFCLKIVPCLISHMECITEFVAWIFASASVGLNVQALAPVCRSTMKALRLTGHATSNSENLVVKANPAFWNSLRCKLNKLPITYHMILCGICRKSSLCVSHLNYAYHHHFHCFLLPLCNCLLQG